MAEDDNKGVIEPLNETDSQGNGLKVNAKYYMQIFDYKKGKSLQRHQQILVDQPLEYFYSFDYNIVNTPEEHFTKQLQSKINYFF